MIIPCWLRLRGADRSEISPKTRFHADKPKSCLRRSASDVASNDQLFLQLLSPAEGDRQELEKGKVDGQLEKSGRCGLRPRTA